MRWRWRARFERYAEKSAIFGYTYGCCGVLRVVVVRLHILLLRHTLDIARCCCYCFTSARRRSSAAKSAIQHSLRCRHMLCYAFSRYKMLFCYICRWYIEPSLRHPPGYATQEVFRDIAEQALPPPLLCRRKRAERLAMLYIHMGERRPITRRAALPPSDARRHIEHRESSMERRRYIAAVVRRRRYAVFLYICCCEEHMLET